MLCPKWGRKTAPSTLSIASEINHNDVIKNGRLKQNDASEEDVTCKAIALAEIIRPSVGGPLGISVDGGVDKDTPPLIAGLRPGSIAHRCDDLQIGDWLISVNGIKVSKLKNDEILVLLRNILDTVTLQLEYDLNNPYFQRTPFTSCKSTDLYLSKECGNFGFTIRGGAYGPDPAKSRPLTVTAVRPGGPADRDGKLRVGDRLICINSTDVSTSTLCAASSLLKKANTKNVCLTIEYDTAMFDSVRHASGPFTLDLHKLPGQDFGVTLKLLQTDGQKSVLVSSVVEASVADRCGALKIGDEILKIDKMTLEYSTLPEVYQLLKNNDRSHIRLEIKPYAHGFNNKTPDSTGTPKNGTAGHRPCSELIRKRDVGSTAVDGRPLNGKSEKLTSSMRKNRESFDGKYAKIRFWDHVNLESAQSIHEYASIIKNSRCSKNWHCDKRSRSIGPCAASTYHCKHNFEGSLSTTISSVPCGQVCRSETMDLSLNCWSRGGYGFLVHRNPSPEPGRNGLFVSYIEKSSPADKCGILHMGDRIVSLNDWCALNGTSDEANYLIRHANGTLNLTVEFDVIETVLPSSGVFTVKLAKRGQFLGIILYGSTTGQKGEPVIVKEIQSGSVAHRCGSIQPDDQLLCIDNIPLDTCTVDEAVRLLQKSSDIVKLRVKKNYSAYDDMEPSSNTVVYTVELNRKGGPLGVTIAGTDDRVDPIVISHIAACGIAEKTGALHVGDRILAINGHSMNGKRVSEAVHLMQQNRETISFKIARFVVDRTSFSHVTHLSPRGLADRPLTTFHGAPYGERGTAGKLGTPVQSIDSAVESLDDSPLIESQQPSTSSNRNSQNSNSKASSLSGNGPAESHYAEDLHLHLHKTLTSLKSGHQNCRSEPSSSSVSTNQVDEDQNYVQLGGDTCPCKNHLHGDESHHDWMQVLDALESVGEAEILRRLEETILSGSVPCPSGGTSSGSGGADRTRPTTPKPPPKPPLNAPFPLTNTILKHPFIGQSKKSIVLNDTSAIMGQMAASPKDFLSCSFLSTGTSRIGPSTSSLVSQAKQSSILSAYEHIPFITSPIASSLCGTADPSRPSPPRSSSETAETPPSTSSSLDDDDLKEMPPLHQPPSSSSCSASISSRLSGSEMAALPSRGAYDPRSVPTPPDPRTVPDLPVRPHDPPATYQRPSREPLPVEMYRVTLLKDSVYNDFGFSVSDGMAQKGVFVNKVRHRGPADLSGNIQPYDRILQVNDTSFQDLDCLLAVPVLAAAGEKIELLIRRDPNLAGSSRRPDSIEEEDESAEQQGVDEQLLLRLTLEQTQV